MKKGNIGKIIVSCCIFAIVAILAIVPIVNYRVKIKTEENESELVEQENLKANVSINTSFGDDFVSGEIIVGGNSTSGAHWYQDGQKNGYCLNHGATLYGTAQFGHTLNASGSAYEGNNARQDCNGQIQWLLDNMMRVNITGTDVSDDEIKLYKENLKNILVKQNHNVTASNFDSLFSNELIFQIQQYVLWQFTNNVENVTPRWINGVNDARVDLYNALLNEANAHSNYNSDGNVNIQIEKGQDFKMKQSGSDVIIGPLTIKNDKNKLYKLNYSNFTFNRGGTENTAVAGTSAFVYKANGQGEITSEEIKNNTYTNYNGKIYVKVTKFNITEPGISVTCNGKISAKTYKTKATYWTNEDLGLQPVVTLSREEAPVEFDVNITNANKKVDLALKKMITNIKRAGKDEGFTEVKKENGFNVDRHNVDGNGWKINLEDLKNNTSTNATYTMNKTPVEVSVGDEIQYDIRIYNEGEVAAKASIVKDYLPNGLKIDVFNENVYKATESNGTVTVEKSPVVYKYKDEKGNNQEIPLRFYRASSEDYTSAVNDGSINKQNYFMYNGDAGTIYVYLNGDNYINNFNKNTNILNKDVITVTCKVQDNATGVLTNVAEIEQYKTSDGKVITTDIDSTSGNWDAPKEAKEGIENYKGTEQANKGSDAWRNYANGNQNNLDGNWHTDFLAQDAGINGNKGDDDDFEKVIVAPDLALKKVITKIKRENKEFEDVTKENGFNVDRKTNEIENNIGVDVTPLKNGDTNATYTMNKTPVQVKIGDEIQYDIRIYNEGKTKAKAITVKDYLPKGLILSDLENCKVKYKYKNEEKEIEYFAWDEYKAEGEKINTKNYFLYADRAGTIDIHLNDIEYIDAFDGNNLSYGTITVICKVQENATGVLTNVAEIVEYKSENNNKDTSDVDSTVYNWNLSDKDPYGEDKGSEAWRNYATGKQGELDGNWHTDFLAQDNSIIESIDEQGNKKYKQGDDDDFEKVIILNEYKLQLQKVSSENNAEKLAGAKFYISDRKYDVNNVNLENTYVTNEYGETSNVVTGITYADKSDEYDVFYIKELNTSNDQRYNLLDAELIFEVKKEVNSTTGVVNVSSYCITARKNNETYNESGFVSINEETELEVPDISKGTVKIKVKYDTENNMFIITIPNNKIAGTYSIELIKTADNFKKFGEGIEFKHTNNPNGEKTNSRGRITLVDSYSITKDNVGKTDVYAITEVEDNENNLLELASPITVKVQKTADSGKYVVNSVTVECDGNTKTIKRTDSTNSIELTDLSTVNSEVKTKVKVTLDKTTQKITIEADNPVVTGKYSLYLKKVVSGAPIQNVTFKVDSKNLPATNNSGITTCTENKQITTDSLQDDEYNIEEISVDTNKYVKIINPIKLTVKKGLDSDGRNYVVTGMKLEATGSVSTIFKEGSKRVSLPGVVLKDGTTVTITATLNSDTQAITLQIPNKGMQGLYTLKIKKVNVANNNPIGNVTFGINQKINGISNTITTEATDTEGLANVSNVELTNENINKVDTYTINEINIDDSYVKLENSISLDVTKEVKTDSTYGVKNIVLYQGNNRTVSGTNVNLENIQLKDGSTVTVNATVEDNEIIVTIPNKLITGKYSIDLLKTAGNYSTKIPGVTFNRLYKNSTKVATTDSNGKISLVKEIIINKNNINTEDTFEVTEVEDKYNNILELASPITITVGKTTDNTAGKYVVNKVTVECNGNTQTINRTDSTNYVELTNLPTVNPEIKAKAKVTLDKTTQKITVMVDNPYINGKYSVNIKKYDNDGNPMQYIVFKVNGKTLTATNAQGITTCVSEKAITKDDYQTADTYVIDEFKVNEKNYVKLSNKIKLTVKKGLNADGKKYVVKGIRLDEIDSNNKIKNSSETTDGTKVELKGIKLSDEKSTVTVVATLDKETQTITLGIPNKKVTGSYSMNLIKTTNNFKTPVQNVDFTWINSSNVKTSETTDTFGYIDIIDKYTITKENIEKTDSYTITEVEDASNKILELASNIVIRVSKTTESGKYVVSKVEVTCGDTKKTITRSDSANYVELTNLPTVNSVKTTTLKVTLDKTTQKITIYADNPTIDGKYNIKLKKTSLSGTGIKDVIFSINGTELNSTNTSGVTTAVSGKNITSENVNKPDTYTIKEVEVDENKYVKLDNPIKLTVKKGLDAEGRNYVVTKVKLEGQGQSSTISTKEANSVSLKGVLLSDGSTVTVNAIYNSNTKTVTVTIPNKDMEGKYTLQLKKVNTTKSDEIKPIRDIIFGVSTTINGVDETKTTLPTDANGIAKVATVTLSDADLNKTDTYTIEEKNIQINGKYVKLKEKISVDVTKEVKTDSTYGVKNIVLYQGDNKTIAGTDVNLEVELEDNSKVVINGSVNNNLITITIPNKLFTGSYNMNLIKTVNNARLEGITFNRVYKNSTKVGKTDSNGEINLVKEIAINKNNVNTPDTFKITEVEDTKNNVVELASPINIKVDKTESGENYIVNKVTVSCATTSNKNDTKEIVKQEGKANFVEFNNVKTVDGNRNAKIKVTLNENAQTADGINQTITVQVDNPKIDGKYNLCIEKTLSGEPLKDMIFNVDINGTVKELEATKEDGLTTVITEKNITTENVNTLDTYTIKEIKTKNEQDKAKYIKLADPIILTVKKGLDAEGKNYTVTGMKLQGTGNASNTISSEGEDTVSISGVGLEDKKSTVTVTATYNSDSKTIILQVPNEGKEGLYTVKIKKVSLATETEKSKVLKGVKFTIDRTIKGISDTITPTTNSQGIAKIASVTLTDNDDMDEVDTYEINEINTDSLKDSYVSLQKSIKLDVYKKSVNNKYSVKNIVLYQGNNKTTAGTNVNLKVKLADDTQVTINAKLQNDEVIVTIPNKLITGKYSIKLIKNTNDFTEKLKGITFTHNNNLLGEETDDNGEIVIEDNYQITKANVGTIDAYTITEVEDKQNNVLELASPITVKVKKITEGGKYVVSKVKVVYGDTTKDLYRSNNGNLSSVILENVPTVKDDKLTNISVSLNKETQEITVGVDNPQIEGEYNLKLSKVSQEYVEGKLEEKPISGVVFTVNDKKLTTNKLGTIKYSADNIKINSNSLKDDEYIVREIAVDENTYVKLKSPVILTVKKGLDADGRNYVITGMKLEATGIKGSISSEGNKSVTLKGVVLKDGTTVTVTATLDEATQTITLKIPNKKIKGSYSLKVKKVNATDSNKPMDGVVFGISTLINEVEDTIITAATNTEGMADVTTVELTSNDINKVDTYTIDEVKVDSLYLKLKNPINLDVYKNVQNGTFGVEKIMLYQGENKSTIGQDVELKVELETGLKGIVEANVANNIITVTIPNKLIKGKYSMNVIKTKNGSPISGVTFENSVSEEPVTTDKNGKITVVESCEINKNNLNTVDTYTIKEVEDKKNNILELASPITVKVQKKQFGNLYVADKITVAYGKTVKEMYRNDTIEITDATTVNSNKKANIKVTFDKPNETIIVNIDNPEVDGKYSLFIEKTLSGEPLKDMIFNVDINGTVKELEATKEDGLTTVITEKNITTENVNTLDTYTIKEIKTKNEQDKAKYIKLADPIILTVKKGLDAEGKNYTVTKMKLEGTDNSANTISSEGEDTVSISGVGLEDKKSTVTVTATYNSDSKTIILQVPNEGKEGLYTVKIKKVSLATKTEKSKVLKGVKFTIDRTIKGISDTITPTTNSEGIAKIASVTLTDNDNMDEVDTYEINEINTNNLNNSYVSLQSPIKLEVHKKSADNKYSIDYIVLCQGQENKSEEKTNVNLQVKLADGTPVTVNAKVQNDEIIVTIPNKIINGNYSIKLTKSTDNFAKKLKGVVFTHNNSALGEKTDSNGEIVIENNYKITKDNVNTEDTYTITEVEDKQNNVLELASPINITVGKTTDNTIGKYVVDTVKISCGNVTKQLSRNSENRVVLENLPTVKEGKLTKINVTLNKETQEIIIDVDNPEVDGKYSLNLRKVCSGVGVEGVVFNVNGTNLSATNASGITKCEENKTITSSTLQSDVYTVEEISIDTNKYIKLAKPVTLTVNKGLDADGKNYIVTGMKLEGTGKNSTTIFKQGVNSVSLSGVILENGLNSDLKNTPTVTVKATYDGNVITVEIPNKEIQGIYSLKIKKVDEENTPISNIYFEGSSIINKATDTFTTEPTNAEGITNVKTVKLTKENYTTTDTFTINEVNIDNSYIKLQSPIALDVNKYIKDNKYVVKEIVLYQDENKTTAGNNVELDNVKLADNSIVKITASVENNVITVTIPNKTVTGKYSMDVVKTTEDYTTTIPGMTFKRIYKDKIKVVKTDDEGVANLVKEFEINKNNLNTIDEYEITEVENVTNEFLELQNAITVKVQKTNDSGEYVVNKVTVTSGNSKGEITRAGDKNYTELANLPTVNPDVKTKVKVTLDKNTQKITVYVQNPPISGKYGLNLRKVCGEKGISGVIFTVNGEKLEATDEDGMVKYLKNQPITDITNEDTYTVEEISVDTNKYIKLAKPVTLKVQKGLDTDGKKYIATGIKLEGTGITNVETGETGIVSQQGQLVSEGKIGVKLNVILENKAEATLQAILDVNSQTITFKIKNELIRGIYALRIRKVDTNNNAPVENVTFNISAKINEKNKTIKTNATNNEGIVNIGRVTLANETLDKADVYEINEINADNSYIKLKNPIYLQVNKCINNYKYCIKDIGLYKIKDGKPDTTGNNVKLENVELKDGTKVEVTATVEDNIITITIPNKPVEGEYNINIQKYDENFTNRLANTKFEYSINNETPKQEVTSEVIDENNGGEISLPKYKITRENVGITDKYVITEIETPSKTYLKLAEPLELNVTKEIIEGVYVIKDITLKNSTESVTLSKETNENSVTLHNIKTVDNNRTANAIVTINRSTQTITIKIENQKIRGSYDLEITKLEELLGTPLQGAKFVIEAYTQKGEQIKLYKNTDDVNSMESIIPGKFTIKNEDGKFSIKDIRIEKPETYILKITEIETPETYTKLRDTIELKVTTKLYEETEKAKYVLDNIELISGENDGLVKLVKNTEDKIELEVTNNQFDLALRKYISSINGEDISRWTKPEVDTSKLITGEETTAEYYNAKAPLRIYKEQEVIYTLRIYNEGQIDGYATEITDYLPEQLEFLPEDEFNTSRGWKYDEQDETLRTIKTNYLSKENGKEEKNADGEKSENSNLIKAFNSKTGEIDYVEVQVKCKVKPNAVAKQLITNIAEITKYEGENRPEVVDRDSKKTAEIPTDRDLPSYKQNEIDKPYVPGQEDDDDFEKLVVEEFDLSLRKFITKVNGKTLEGENSREPVVDTSKLVSGEETTAKYTHTKEPIEVAYKNVVEYTIRVFNEGTVDGYANIVKDDIPDGLVFVPEDETNKQYGWRMLDKDGKETTNAKKAEYIVTEYLSMENGRSINNVSKEDMQENNGTSKVVSEEETAEYEDVKNANVIKAFDASKMETLDYKEVKAVFKVDAPDKKDNIIINKAQISEDTDEYGKPVKDKDSTTDVWIEGEDDQDREYLKLVYFDLALRKWVSQAIVYENGVEKVTQTGHTGYENPEPVVKVDLGKNILDKVVVKFKYQIKVTNEGIVPGYVKEISDYIPEGLRFEQSDNPTWEEKDGKVVTSEVENVLLQPGESVTVGIVLTWNNAKDNLGLKINIAEISKDYNEYGDTPDIDSTPDNKTAGEDDIDTAPVMLAVRTGDVNVPVMIIILSMCYIAVCAVAIKRVFYKKK